MQELFVHDWAAMSIATLAATFNLYAMQAEKGQYPMGQFVWRYRVFIEFTNWLLLLGMVLFLSYNYTWYILLSFFAFPVLGSLIASILKGLTQVAYILAMPLLLFAFAQGLL